MILTVGASIDSTHVTLVVRRGPGASRAFQKIERDLLLLVKHPNALVWDTLRLTFRRAGQGDPLPVWQEFATAVSTVARSPDVLEAKLVRQREEAM